MTVLHDVRFAVRLLIKEKWFTLAAVVALALGLGANSAVFTFVNAVLIRGVPFDDPDRIMSIGGRDAKGRLIGVSLLDFEDIRAGSRAFSGMSAFIPTTMNISDEGRAPEQFFGSYGSANLFSIIGQRPLIGRDFGVDDDKPGAEPVVIVGDGIWKNRYGADPDLVGRTIKVNSVACTVIGIMPPDMRFPNNNDVWVPLSLLPPEMRESKRGMRSFQTVGRLGPGVTTAQAQAELDTIAAKLARDFPETNKDVRPNVVTFNERQTGPQIKLMFVALMGAVAFVLLIACANVANLLLARSAHRSREIAVRASLGAGRWRIVRQLLVESLILSAVSGVLGVGIGYAGVRAFDRVTTEVGKPYWMKFTMDSRVFLFIGAVCVGTSIVFGLAPALQVSRTDVNEIMKEGGGRSGTGGMRARRWTSALMVVEIALTLVLLAGAGFMMRSFMALYNADLGIDTSRLLTMRLYLPLSKYPKPEPRIALFQRIEERLRGVTAIEVGALTTNPPMSGGFPRQLELNGRPAAAGERLPEVTMVSVSPGYFDTIGLQIVRGRGLTDLDGTPGHENAIVNLRFVAMHFGGEDPLGRQIRLVDASPQLPSPPVVATIVGVIPTMRQRNFQEPDPDPVVYLPYRADPQRFLALVVRTHSAAGTVTSVIREEMRAIEPDLPLFSIQTMDERLAQERWPFRVFGTMFALFAGIALVLSAIGLYAVTAYSVTQRTSEIGVRMALGAQSTQVMWLVMKRAFVQLGIGLPIGVAGAFGVGRLLQTLLAQTSARDPLTIGSIAGLMAMVSLAACLWPARRATRLDPLKALRYE